MDWRDAWRVNRGGTKFMKTYRRGPRLPNHLLQRTSLPVPRPCLSPQTPHSATFCGLHKRWIDNLEISSSSPETTISGHLMPQKSFLQAPTRRRWCGVGPLVPPVLPSRSCTASDCSASRLRIVWGYSDSCDRPASCKAGRGRFRLTRRRDFAAHSRSSIRTLSITTVNCSSRTIRRASSEPEEEEHAQASSGSREHRHSPRSNTVSQRVHCQGYV
jgi:hypothetical protein